jgi:Cas7 group CRISPR-associated protein Csh2
MAKTKDPQEVIQEEVTTEKDPQEILTTHKEVMEKRQEKVKDRLSTQSLFILTDNNSIFRKTATGEAGPPSSASIKRVIREELQHLGYPNLYHRGYPALTLGSRIKELVDISDSGEVRDKVIKTFPDAAFFGSPLATKDVSAHAIRGATQVSDGCSLHPYRVKHTDGFTVMKNENSGGDRGTTTSKVNVDFATWAVQLCSCRYTAEDNGLWDSDEKWFEKFIRKALWKGIQRHTKTSAKFGVVPRLFLTFYLKNDVVLDNLHALVDVIPVSNKEPEDWTSTQDYIVDLSAIKTLAEQYRKQIDRIEIQRHPLCQITEFKPEGVRVVELDLDDLKPEKQNGEVEDNTIELGDEPCV